MAGSQTPNPIVTSMPRLVDLGSGYYLNISAISHIIDNEAGKTCAVYMNTTQADRFGQLQPLQLRGTIRDNLLAFVEDMDVEATNYIPANLASIVDPNAPTT